MLDRIAEGAGAETEASGQYNGGRIEQVDGGAEGVTIVEMSLLCYVDESADHLNHFHAGVLLNGTQAACAEEALDEIAAWNDKYGAGSLHGKCFQNLLERLNERLKTRAAHALVIIDEHASKKQLKQEMKWAKKFRTCDSRESRLIQLADIAVFTRRRRALGTEKHPNAEAGLKRMHSLVQAATPLPTGRFDTLYRAYR